MNFGPLEFAAYLRRKQAQRRGSDTAQQARASATAPADNQLTIISGPKTLAHRARDAQIEAVSVYEAVAMRVPSAPTVPGPVRVVVKNALRPIVLVLTSHQTVAWHLEIAPGAQLAAVLLSGAGASTVAGAGAAPVTTIGGFYAFKRGSAEFLHLEREVLRCTGRTIENFQSLYAGGRFEIGGD